jgi:hypothetical protein
MVRQLAARRPQAVQFRLVGSHRQAVQRSLVGGPLQASLLRVAVEVRAEELRVELRQVVVGHRLAALRRVDSRLEELPRAEAPVAGLEAVVARVAATCVVGAACPVEIPLNVVPAARTVLRIRKASAHRFVGTIAAPWIAVMDGSPIVRRMRVLPTSDAVSYRARVGWNAQPLAARLITPFLARLVSCCHRSARIHSRRRRSHGYPRVLGSFGRSSKLDAAPHFPRTGGVETSQTGATPRRRHPSVATAAGFGQWYGPSPKSTGIRYSMVNRHSSTRWTRLSVVIQAAMALFGPAGCSKPQPSAPIQDFARRHHCSVSAVDSDKEGSDRMRVSGCGDSEIYVRMCETGGAPLPQNDARQLITEAEAKHSSARQATGSPGGCAWTRQKSSGLSRSDGKSQPKWLSNP